MNNVNTCLLIASLSLLPIYSQETVSFTGPRSLMTALLEVQKATGVPVNYEEPPYESGADLIRTTTASHPGLRPMIIARTSPSAVVVPFYGSHGARDAGTLVEAVVDAYNKRDLPGRYMVVRRTSRIDVVPDEVASAGGSMKKVKPIMSQPIVFPYRERSVAETFQLMIDAISKASGRQVKPLMNPFGAFMMTRIASSANGPSISDELSNLGAKLGIGSVFYTLAFDPNDNSYYLTVSASSRPHPDGPGRREPNPASSENPFFIKTKP